MTAPKNWIIKIIDADRFNCSICGREIDARGGYVIHRGQFKICPACSQRYPEGKRLTALITTWESWNPPEYNLDDIPEFDLDDLIKPLDLDSLNLNFPYPIIDGLDDPLTPPKSRRNRRSIKKGKSKKSKIL